MATKSFCLVFHTRLPLTAAALAMALASLSVVINSIALYVYQLLEFSCLSCCQIRSNDKVSNNNDLELQASLFALKKRRRDYNGSHINQQMMLHLIVILKYML